MRGMDYRDYYACVPEDGLIEDIRRYHRAMEPALERLVAIPVSYTHLDVYKRQTRHNVI